MTCKSVNRVYQHLRMKCGECAKCGSFYRRLTCHPHSLKAHSPDFCFCLLIILSGKGCSSIHEVNVGHN